MHGEASDHLADILEGMDNDALLEVVRKEKLEDHLLVPDAFWVLHRRTAGNAQRQRALDLEDSRWETDLPIVAAREEDLGWDVLRTRTERILQAFPGPKAAKSPTHLEGMAEQIVHNRLAREALEWLEAYEAGGAARVRAVRKAETR